MNPHFIGLHQLLWVFQNLLSSQQIQMTYLLKGSQQHHKNLFLHRNSPKLQILSKLSNPSSVITFPQVILFWLNFVHLQGADVV